MTSYINSGDQVEKEMGGACGTHGRKLTKGFQWGNLLKEKGYFLAVDKRMILKWFVNKLD
jgi:hypothetical protein